MPSPPSPAAEHHDLVSRLREDADFRVRFHSKYSDKKTLATGQIGRLKVLFEDKKTGLSQVTKNAKLTVRVKEEESAIRTLKRRQKQCLDLGKLKLRLEKRGEDYEEYWVRQTDPPSWKDDHRPYQDIDEMLSALPDIAGMRICVYSPEDVEKVVDYLNDLYIPDHGEGTARFFDHRKHLLAKPPQVIRRGQGPDHLHELEHHIKSLEKRDDTHPTSTEKVSHYQEQFPGYRATHVRVQLKPDLVYDGIQLKGNFFVEIQIMTVIMDAWAQVVHGLTYKPDMPPSDSLRILLDQLGGIVLLGETTLTQVSRVRQDLQDKHTQRQGAIPNDWYELGAWLSGACKTLEPNSFAVPNSTSSTPKFGKLDEFRKVLSVTNAHTYGDLQELLEKVYQDHGSKIITYHLPIHLLRALTENRKAHHLDFAVVDDDDNDDDNVEAFFRQTRRKAQKVVHIINMAGFLDIGDDFVKYAHRAMQKLAETAPKNNQSKTPSMIEMLDILHHEKPQARDFSSMRNIQDFSQDFYENSCLADVVKDTELLAVLELPRMLVNAGYVARPIFDDTSKNTSQGQTTVIPRDLCAFLDDVDDTHFIPEILNVAQKIAERNSEEEVAPDKKSAAGGNGLLAATATRWLGSRRLRFEPKIGEEDFFRVLVDLMEVPMRSSFDPMEGTMVLEIDKQKDQMWPHPGFFSASTTVCTNRDHDHGKRPRWKYIESKANYWSIDKLRDESASCEFRNKPPGANNFLRLFRRLHLDCNAIMPFDEDAKIKHYRFKIKEKCFWVSSTPEKYILKEETRPRLD